MAVAAREAMMATIRFVDRSVLDVRSGALACLRPIRHRLECEARVEILRERFSRDSSFKTGCTVGPVLTGRGQKFARDTQWRSADTCTHTGFSGDEESERNLVSNTRALLESGTRGRVELGECGAQLECPVLQKKTGRKTTWPLPQDRVASRVRLSPSMIQSGNQTISQDAFH